MSISYDDCECREAAELPTVFRDYCRFVEQYLGTRIGYVSNGTGRDQLLVMP